MPAGRPQLYQLPDFEAWLTGPSSSVKSKLMVRAYVRTVSKILAKIDRDTNLERLTFACREVTDSHCSHPSSAWNAYAEFIKETQNREVPRIDLRVRYHKLTEEEEAVIEAISMLHKIADLTFDDLMTLQLSQTERRYELIAGDTVNKDGLKFYRIHFVEGAAYIPLTSSLKPLRQHLNKSWLRANLWQRRPFYVFGDYGRKPDEGRLLRMLNATRTIQLRDPATPRVIRNAQSDVFCEFADPIEEAQELFQRHPELSWSETVGRANPQLDVAPDAAPSGS